MIRVLSPNAICFYVCMKLFDHENVKGKGGGAIATSSEINTNVPPRAQIYRHQGYGYPILEAPKCAFSNWGERDTLLCGVSSVPNTVVEMLCFRFLIQPWAAPACACMCMRWYTPSTSPAVPPLPSSKKHMCRYGTSRRRLGRPGGNWNRRQEACGRFSVRTHSVCHSFGLSLCYSAKQIAFTKVNLPTVDAAPVPPPPCWGGVAGVAGMLVMLALFLDSPPAPFGMSFIPGVLAPISKSVGVQHAWARFVRCVRRGRWAENVRTCRHSGIGQCPTCTVQRTRYALV